MTARLLDPIDERRNYERIEKHTHGNIYKMVFSSSKTTC